MDDPPTRSDDRDRDERGSQDPSDDSPERDDRHRDGEQDEGGDEACEDDGPALYRRPIFWIVGGILAAVLLIAILLYWLHARQYESTDDAFVDAHIVRIAPEVSGRLVAVPAQDNRHVRAGTLLAEVEPYNSEAQKAQSLAELAQARAQLEQAEAQVIQARAAHAQAVQNAVAPAADAARAARDYRRYQALVRLDPAAAAATQVDAARAQAESTAAQAAAARRQADSAAANVAVARKQAEAAGAEVEAARARLAQSNVTVGHLRIVAPISGQIVHRSVNVGSYVEPGTQIMAIVPDSIWVTANFKETQLRRMRLGQHADIKVDAFPEVHFEGHVDSIQRGAGQAFALLPPQNATGNYVKVVQRVPVRILFDRPDPRRWAIGPGMSVVPRVKVR